MPETPYRSPLLHRHGAVAASGPDEGIAWHYGDPTAEQRALARGTAVSDMSHLGVVTVSGPDRLTWLHSITSAYLEGLPPHESRELFVLSPQGHIEHWAGLVDDGTTTWLITEPDHAATLTQWLTRMKFMMQVDITDATEQWAAVGTPNATEGTPDEPITWRDPWPHTLEGGTRYGVPDHEHPGMHRPWRLQLIPRDTLVAHISEHEQAGRRLVGTWATEALRVEAWRPRLATEIDHRSIPHELDWLRTAVHLHKGCYRGQETIARVHNLGRPPRRLVMIHLDGSGHLLPEPGAEVRVGDKPVGTITTVARHHELGPIALAVVKRNVAEDAEFLVDCDGGAVSGGQEVIVPSGGVSADRPHARGETSRDARGQNNLSNTMGRFL